LGVVWERWCSSYTLVVLLSDSLTGARYWIVARRKRSVIDTTITWEIIKYVAGVWREWRVEGEGDLMAAAGSIAAMTGVEQKTVEAMLADWALGRC